MKKSEQINDLAAALAKAQAEVAGAHKSSANPFFKSKYADLASVWDACREPLTKNGLSVAQFPVTEIVPFKGIDDKGKEFDGSFAKVTVITLLMHSSGQWIEDASFTAEAKDAGPQSIGSAVTYLRRYSLQAVAGVAPEDDDGNAAQRPNERPVSRTTTTNSNGQSEQFAKFTDWIKDNIPELFTDRNDAWARVKLAASQQKHNDATLRSCTDPKVFDAIKSILSVTDPVAA